MGRGKKITAKASASSSSAQALSPRPRATVPPSLLTNALDVLPRQGLEEKLALGRPLRVKFGIDVTSPDIHLGRGIPLQRLRAFQDEGHKAVLIVGDYTTRIGDPSGRSSERPILSAAEIDENAERYLEQAMVILRDEPELLEVRRNGEWLSKLSFADVVALTRTLTVSRLLERDDFKKRFDNQEPISVSELLYPLMQAYDSVAVASDVEIGGSDQLYNLLAGRVVQEAYGQEPQVAMTFPILTSWDGKKMASSEGNNIPLLMDGKEQFGRTMRIADEQLPEWYGLLLESEPPADLSPMEAKLALARELVRRSHGDAGAQAAAADFDRVVRNKEAPAEVSALKLPDEDPVHLPALLAAAFSISRNEARRLLEGGAVTLDGTKVQALDAAKADLAGKLLKAGKRRFVRLG